MDAYNLNEDEDVDDDFSSPKINQSMDELINEDGVNKKSRIVNNRIALYENNPVFGWTKEIVCNSEGQTVGVYLTPQIDGPKRKRIRGKVELQNYISVTGLSKDIMKHFVFGNVFCLCHQIEDHKKYFACAWGKEGCNRWFHAECVGIQENKLASFVEEFICPLCTAYLRKNNHRFLSEKTYICLDSSTIELINEGLSKIQRPNGRGGFIEEIPTITKIEGFEILQYQVPHRVWGLEGTSQMYTRKEFMGNDALSSNRNENAMNNDGESSWASGSSDDGASDVSSTVEHSYRNDMVDLESTSSAYDSSAYDSSALPASSTSSATSSAKPRSDVIIPLLQNSMNFKGVGLEAHAIGGHPLGPTTETAALSNCLDVMRQNFFDIFHDFLNFSKNLNPSGNVNALNNADCNPCITGDNNGNSGNSHANRTISSSNSNLINNTPSGVTPDSNDILLSSQGVASTNNNNSNTNATPNNVIEEKYVLQTKKANLLKSLQYLDENDIWSTYLASNTFECQQATMREVEFTTNYEKINAMNKSLHETEMAVKECDTEMYKCNMEISEIKKKIASLDKTKRLYMGTLADLKVGMNVAQLEKEKIAKQYSASTVAMLRNLLTTSSRLKIQFNSQQQNSGLNPPSVKPKDIYLPAPPAASTPSSGPVMYPNQNRLPVNPPISNFYFPPPPSALRNAHYKPNAPPLPSGGGPLRNVGVHQHGNFAAPSFPPYYPGGGPHAGGGGQNFPSSAPYAPSAPYGNSFPYAQNPHLSHGGGMIPPVPMNYQQAPVPRAMNQMYEGMRSGKPNYPRPLGKSQVGFPPSIAYTPTPVSNLIPGGPRHSVPSFASQASGPRPSQLLPPTPHTLLTQPNNPHLMLTLPSITGLTRDLYSNPVDVTTKPKTNNEFNESDSEMDGRVASILGSLQSAEVDIIESAVYDKPVYDKPISRPPDRMKKRLEVQAARANKKTKLDTARGDLKPIGGTTASHISQPIPVPKMLLPENIIFDPMDFRKESVLHAALPKSREMNYAEANCVAAMSDGTTVNLSIQGGWMGLQKVITTKEFADKKREQDSTVKKASKSGKGNQDAKDDSGGNMNEKYRSMLWDYVKNLTGPVELPGKCYITIDGGGIVSTCMKSGMITSLSDLCAGRKHCGYCLSSIEETSNSKYSSREIICSTSNFSIGKEKSSKVNPNYHVFMDSESNISCSIHFECAATIQSKLLNKVTSNDSRDGAVIESHDTYTLAKNKICALCCRLGGLLQKVSINMDVAVLSSYEKTVLSAWNTGVYAHPLCISWLKNTYVSEFMSRPEGNTLSEHQGKFFSSMLKSLSIGNNGRCSLCNVESGYTLRCCSPSCTIRAHPICAEMSKSLCVIQKENCPQVNANPSVTCFMCSLHQ